MGYLQRAKSMHDRGEAVRAAILLAEGLKRDHQNSEALEYLLHLYVEEIPNPGMEKALLRVLDMQPNGLELFEIIEAELREMGRDAKVDALHEVRGLEGFLEEPPPAFEPPEPQQRSREPEPERFESEPELDPRDSSGLWREELESRRAGTDDRWEAFENPLAPRAPRRSAEFEREDRPSDSREPRADSRGPRSSEELRRFDDFDDLHRQGSPESPAWVRFAGLAILLAAVVLMVISIVGGASDDDAEEPVETQDSLHQPEQPVESPPPEPDPEPEYEPPPVQDDIVIDEDETDQLEMEGSG